jgi:hypothetical protein
MGPRGRVGWGSFTPTLYGQGRPPQGRPAERRAGAAPERERAREARGRDIRLETSPRRRPPPSPRDVVFAAPRGGLAPGGGTV